MADGGASMTVLILMATCEGAAFIAAQVASIQAQTHTDWHLLVRDDASTDATPALLARQAAADPRIELLTGPRGRLGVARNFAWLIALAAQRAPAYVALADQDDVWRADKLARQLQVMQGLEQGPTGAAMPCLVHADLAVVDAGLRLIHPSFAGYQGLRWPDGPAPLTTLFQNHVVGCTILANRALLAIAAPVPPGIHMHDWWFNLCGRFAGATGYVAEPLVKYRQHQTNRVGARGAWGLLGRPRRWHGWLGKMACLYRRAWLQGAWLRARLIPASPMAPAGGPDSSGPRAALDEALAHASGSRARRLAWLLRRRVRLQHPALTALLWAQALTLDPERTVVADGCREHR